MNIKQNILAQCRAQNVQVTPLREHVLDIVLQLDGVITAYPGLAQMQRESDNVLAAPWTSGQSKACCTKSPP